MKDLSGRNLDSGFFNESWTPMQVKGPGDVGNLTGIIAISCGAAHIIALKNDVALLSLGDNA